jgi:hypothetical protein
MDFQRNLCFLNIRKNKLIKLIKYSHEGFYILDSVFIDREKLITLSDG